MNETKTNSESEDKNQKAESCEPSAQADVVMNWAAQQESMGNRCRRYRRPHRREIHRYLLALSISLVLFLASTMTVGRANVNTLLGRSAEKTSLLTEYWWRFETTSEYDWQVVLEVETEREIEPFAGDLLDLSSRSWKHPKRFRIRELAGPLNSEVTFSRNNGR